MSTIRSRWARYGSVPWAALAAILLSSSGSSEASGFAISAQDARAFGMANAFVAVADDAAALFFNPAGLAQVESRVVSLGGALTLPKGEFVAANRQLETNLVLVPPFADYVQPISSGLTVGIGLHVPYGSSVRWRSRADADRGSEILSADLKGFSLIHGIGARLGSRLSFGAGLYIHWASLTIDPASSTTDIPVPSPFETVTTSDVGFSVGVLSRPSPKVAIGASYRHGVRLGGESALITEVAPAASPSTLSDSPSLPVTLPSRALVGAAIGSDSLRVSFDVEWQHWSTMQALAVEGSSNPSSSDNLSYGNVLLFKAGVERRGRRVSVRSGYALDPGAGNSTSSVALFPEGPKHRACLGFSYRMDRFRVDVGYQHAFSLRRLRTFHGLAGESQTRADTISYGLAYAY
jgi:long-chain fatty acid transport protein